MNISVIKETLSLMWSQSVSTITNILIAGFFLSVVIVHFGALILTIGLVVDTLNDNISTISNTGHILVYDGILALFWISVWSWAAYKEVKMKNG